MWYFAAIVVAISVDYLMKYYLASDSALHLARYSASTIDLAIILTHKSLHPSFISKEKCALRLTKFKNIQFLLHTYFNSGWSSFLTVSKVCNISNNYWLPYKSAKNIFTRDKLQHYFGWKSNCTLHRWNF